MLDESFINLKIKRVEDFVRERCTVYDKYSQQMRLSFRDTKEKEFATPMLVKLATLGTIGRWCVCLLFWLSKFNFMQGEQF